MPTIDTETFQFIALVLLGVIAFTGLIALLQLGGLRKALRGLSPGTAPASTDEAAAEQPEAADAEPASDEALGDDAGYSSGIQPLGGADLLDEAAAEAKDAQAAEAARAQQAYQAEQERQALQAEAERQAQQAGGAAEEPQEQPFERDGRWWFRRGDELLVYEEQTGQWVAAPPAQPEGTGVAAEAAEQTHEGRAPVEETQTEETRRFPEEPGPFWKCPTCGAVNGSIATSCRMCFTQRPEGV